MMHNEITSYIQSTYAADGVEVRAVGPKAITLVLPPEMHDLGNFCGELEMRFNARIDIVAQSTPGLGPTATVWVAPTSADGDGPDGDDRGGGAFSDNEDGPEKQTGDDDDAKGAAKAKAKAEAEETAANGGGGWWHRNRRCFQVAVGILTTAAAALTVLRHGAALLDGVGFPSSSAAPGGAKHDL